jgi:hypothetical protein
MLCGKVWDLLLNIKLLNLANGKYAEKAAHTSQQTAEYSSTVSATWGWRLQ